MKEILEKIKNKYIVKNKKERKKTFFKKYRKDQYVKNSRSS